MTDLSDSIATDTPVSLDQVAPSEHELVRELVLQAHPEVVPALVRGDTIGELLASIEPARQAYADLADRIGQQATAPSVPAGGASSLPTDLARIPAMERIKRGLAARR
jgi:hypothetical protein